METYVASKHRYTTMIYHACGESGLKLPAISLGLWHNFSHESSMYHMKEMCFTAFDHGITHFDVANNYGPPQGAAEENLGSILRSSLAPYRDELIISTKAGYFMWEGPYGNLGSKKYLVASLDQSLKRLGTDYVDIFYHHRPDDSTPLYETMWALDSIVKSGKALYIGLSNYSGERMKQAAAILQELHCPFVINQNKYSILNRNAKNTGLLDAAKELRKGVIAFSPLAQGLLTNRYLSGEIEDGHIKSGSQISREGNLTNETLSKLRRLNELAVARGQTLAQMSLAWVYSNPAVTSVLIGASRARQILDNLEMLENPNFTEEELALIDQIAL